MGIFALVVIVVGLLVLVTATIAQSKAQARARTERERLRDTDSSDKDEPSRDDRRLDDRAKAAGVGRLAGLGLTGLGVALVLFASFYTQGVGEAMVLRSVTGAVTGQTTTSGLHVKAPWVSLIKYDVRNNTVTYVGDGKAGDHSGGSATGPQITFQDKDQVTGNLDLVVRYSIQPGSVMAIYSQFTTQQDFVSKVIANDVRQTARDVPARYSTTDLMTNRAKAASDIQDALASKWQSDGIVVDAVNLQEIRYPDDVKQRFADAQNARIAVQQAQAEQDKATVEAQTKKIAAGGEADANRVLAQSLTPEVLQQHYIDALSKSGTVYVVPQGSTPLIGTGPVTSAPSVSSGK